MKVVKIVPAAPPLLERANDAFAGLPTWGKFGLVAATPVAIAAAVAVGLEVAAVGWAACSLIAIAGVVSGDTGVTGTPMTSKEAASYTDPDGNPLAEGHYYSKHPRQPSVMILTDDYHHHILREQQRQLISYIRSRVAVRRLQIAVSYQGEVSVEVKHSFFGARRDEKLSGAHSCDLTYDPPQKVQCNEDLFWLDHFSNVRAALEDSNVGRKMFKEQFGKNLSCGIDVATKFGFKAESVRAYSLQVQIDF